MGGARRWRAWLPTARRPSGSRTTLCGVILTSITGSEIYVGVWHLLYHTTKAFVSRLYGAEMKHILGALDVDGRKESEASNYRVAHHTISSLTAMLNRIVTMYNSKYGAVMDVTNAGAAAGSAAEAPDSATTAASAPTETSVRAPAAATTPPMPSNAAREVQTAAVRKESTAWPTLSVGWKSLPPP